ncbi:ABC transporter substrate-binding protein [Bradyrhizobium sp. WBOS7]|uniref:ABC transporter substrate-binding protein n=1 Tax=Bradyrhizobium betae TaxID=244734 RepID=A0AAE9NCQ8_9BRAD|nr:MULTISPECIES: ABC transporter substrate-binding protein [Bradyrhizobium]MDD1569499.1 ABC transporter substrate-binding protein [Bradyrhizobium sp. WBOS1]UUO35997.1 ABC transporter substrate-binding protein [Bradyrhizobium sp. WBOS01]MDD1526188.1 ABC transporter substrate-binding protein [Bradyrhizobium sp. WBOS2]MDD1575598.1 ABC transporter substrate-binding protein [Bradyrhizobium sp. WBOS7]MDD1599813.1 ABC transporter substrate-binding protein [Bradyrhizobium sp. WBOS16]
MLKSIIAAAALSLVAGSALAQTKTEIVMQYPYPELFTETHKRIAEEFAKVHPEIKVTMRAPYESYEDATQKVLREAVTNQMPDVSFQGLNRIRVLVDKNIPAPLDGYIGAEKDFDKQGFHQAMYDIGTAGGKVYALPFAISLPIVYVNLDLVKQAGGDVNNLPKTWDELLTLAKKIKALGNDTNGVTYAWDITGNWLWQAPVFARGGTMLNADETKVAFDGVEGKFAINTIARLVNEGGMPNLDQPSMRAAFASGKTGFHITSTSDLNKVTQMTGGKFALKTIPFPDVVSPNGRLPAGGNVVLILAKDKAKRDAAWEAVKFWTGPKGAAIMAETTGYMPPNKVANDVYLKDFYVKNPNNYTAVSQLALLTKWYAFPGDNGLKITDVIKDHLNSIISGARAKEPEAVLADMTADVQKLLPKTTGAAR